MRNILSAVWAGGKLGCAFYEKETAQMLVLPDVADSQPEFEILKLILRQANPSAVIVSCRQDERFLAALRSLSRRSNGGAETEGGRRENDNDGGSQFSFDPFLPSSVASAEHIDDDEGFCVHVLRGKDFAPDPCKSRLLRQRLPEEPPGRTDKEHLLYMQSLLPFSNEKMVRAAGALLMFLDEHASSYGIDLLGGAIPVLDIAVWQLNDLVLVDDTAWESLQIFSSELHPMGVQRTRYSKEGLSLYNHLNKCRTAQGTKFLRLMLSRPVRNVDILKRRHDVIEYCCHPSNMDFVKSASECLRGTKNLPVLLSKISLLHPSAKDWRELYQTLYQYVALAEVMGHQRGTIELFVEVREPSKLNAIKVVVEEMMRVIDFNESKHEGRLIPNVGVSRDLDRMRKQYSALPQVMTEIAAEEILSLPEYIQECSIIYLPEVGFRLAVISSEEEYMDLDGYEFQFTNNNSAYFRSSRTQEMDAVFGDLVIGMLDAETNIMLNLAGIILAEKSKLLEIGALMSELDCLMALSAVSNESNFVRPTILPAREMLEIKDGRHPLVASVTSFVPNSTGFEGEERVVLLTGPNASGKSVYVKQVGIIALMALCGSFVPATSARIPLYDRICTRIHVCESLSSGLSAFMADINQMTLALRTSTASSLVLVDEFGKGTAEADGLGLLVASLENFLQRVQECPTVFLSTHFYSITEYLQATSLIKMQTMEFTEDQNQIVYLHKLKDGICQSSLAFIVAKAAGIEDSAVQRSLEIGDAIQRQLIDDKKLAQELSPKELILLEIGSNFLSMQIEEESVNDYLEFIRSRVASFRSEDVVMVNEEDNNEGDVAMDNEEYLVTPLQTERTFSDRRGVAHDDQIDDGESMLYSKSSVLDDTIDSNASPVSSSGGYCGPANSVGVVSVVPYSFGSSTTRNTGNFNEDLEETSFYFNTERNSRESFNDFAEDGF